MLYLLLFTVPKGLLILLPLVVLAFVTKHKIRPADLFSHDPYPSSTCSMEDIVHYLEYRQVHGAPKPVSQTELSTLDQE